jgi:hypothetical protein
MKQKNLKQVMRPKNTHLDKELRRFCNELKKHIGESPTIVELGSYMGESSLIFSEEFPNAKITCIDSWEGGFDNMDTCSSHNYSDVEEQFDYRMESSQNITKIKGLSTSVKLECDVVYIDACHKYECVKEDIQHWLPLVGKVISGHDYYLDPEFIKTHPHIKGVKLAIDEILGTPDMVFNDGSWFKIIK